MLYFPYMAFAANGENGVVSVVKSIVRFPVWWYTTGLVYTAKRLGTSVERYSRSLALGVWLRNILVPMFGQRDWQSRVISFLVRCAQIVFRGAALSIWVGICALQFAVYVLLPIVALLFFIYHVTGGVFGIYG